RRNVYEFVCGELVSRPIRIYLVKRRGTKHMVAFLRLYQFSEPARSQHGPRNVFGSAVQPISSQGALHARVRLLHTGQLVWPGTPPAEAQRFASRQPAGGVAREGSL